MGVNLSGLVGVELLRLEYPEGGITVNALIGQFQGCKPVIQSLIGSFFSDQQPIRRQDMAVIKIPQRALTETLRIRGVEEDQVKQRKSLLLEPA